MAVAHGIDDARYQVGHQNSIRALIQTIDDNDFGGMRTINDFCEGLDDQLLKLILMRLVQNRVIALDGE